MPRIMGIGSVSKLSKKHKTKKAGSFKGLGVVLEGSAVKSQKYGKSLRGTPEQHAGRFGTLRLETLNHLQHNSCQSATSALLFAGKAAEAAESARGSNPRLVQEARGLVVRADAAIYRNCGCKSKK